MSHQRSALQRRSSALPADPEAGLPLREEDCVSTSPTLPSPTAPHSHEPPGPARMRPPPPAAAPAAGADNRSSSTESSITVPSKSKSGGKLRKKLKKSVLSIREKLLMIWRERYPAKVSPSPVAFPDESNADKLPEEDRRRRIRLVITNEHTEFTEGKQVTTRVDKFMATAIAYFDFNFTEGPAERPFILVNEVLVDDTEFTRYDDPENPPIPLRNPDGTKMKLLGEFFAKWSPEGPIKEYAGQQIFLGPTRSHKSRFVVLPKESPFDALVGLGTIKELSLDTPVVLIASIEGDGQGQGGKRPPKPPVDPKAAEEKEAELALIRDAERRAQDKKEKKREKENKKTKPKMKDEKEKPDQKGEKEKEERAEARQKMKSSTRAVAIP